MSVSTVWVLQSKLWHLVGFTAGITRIDDSELVSPEVLVGERHTLNAPKRAQREVLVFAQDVGVGWNGFVEVLYRCGVGFSLGATSFTWVQVLRVDM